MTRLDRRALFSTGGAAALLAATGISLEAKPRAGGHLRIALPKDGESLELLANRAVFDTLTEISPSGLLKGELAQQWQTDSEARNWQIDLRQDVTFHDGTPLTSCEVVNTLKSQLNITSEIKEIGEFRLSIELQDAKPDLPFTLAGPQYAIKRAESIGTGCYTTDQFEPGRRFIGHKTRNHFKSGQAGWVNTIEAVVIGDSAVRAEALRDGFVDIATFPKPDLLRNISEMVFYPSTDDMVVATTTRVGRPGKMGIGTLDDGRLSERWWLI